MRERTIEAGVLDVAFREYGDEDGWPCILLHGFPYDALAYAEAAPILAGRGARVVVPWLRGYGPTRFLSKATPRSGEQAALGADLLALMDALGIERAVLGGYDWGGRAACVVSALWPERVVGLVTGNGYNMHDVARSAEPAPAVVEARFWYQYLFQIERGRQALLRDRRDVARHLWRTWSPEWDFDDATFEATAAAFDNPDWVDVVIHSYRVRYGRVPGDPAYAAIEEKLAAQPPIPVPAIHIDGSVNGVRGPGDDQPEKFTGSYRHEVWAGAGHNLPQERPERWAETVLAVRGMAQP